MIAHLLNVEWYNNSRQGVYDDLSTALSNLSDNPQQNTTYLNPIRITDLVSDPTTSSDNNDYCVSNQSEGQVGLGSASLMVTFSRVCDSF